MTSDLLPGLLGVAEGGGDLGFDVGGSSLLADNVRQQVDEHLVVLQQRHCAVLPVKGQVGPQRPDVHVDLARVLTFTGLQTNKAEVERSFRGTGGERTGRVGVNQPEAQRWAG